MLCTSYTVQVFCVASLFSAFFRLQEENKQTTKKMNNKKKKHKQYHESEHDFTHIYLQFNITVLSLLVCWRIKYKFFFITNTHGNVTSREATRSFPLLFMEK